jgi:hypothetical protein
VGIGSTIGVLTLASLIIVLKYLGWAFYFDHWHNVAGIVFGVLCLLLVLGGIAALVTKRYIDFDWQTKRMLQLASVHKYFGYFVIITVQLAVTTGIMRRITLLGLGKKSKEVWLVVVNLLLFVGSLAVGEYRH